MMETLMIVLYFLIFSFGACVGSFIGLLVKRSQKTSKSLGKVHSSRSVCDTCGRKLGFFDLIPIISFFLRRGKCFKCGAKIDPSYPVLELFSGIFFVITSLLYFNEIFEISKVIFIALIGLFYLSGVL